MAAVAYTLRNETVYHVPCYHEAMKPADSPLRGIPIEIIWEEFCQTSVVCSTCKKKIIDPPATV